MSTQEPREVSPGRMRADARTVITMSVLAAIAVISLAAQKLLNTFTPGGVAWSLPVERKSATAQGLTLYTGSGPQEAPPLTGTITRLEVLVPDLNTVSMVCLALSIVLAALTLLTVIACTAFLAWRFLRGEFFTPRTSIAIRTLMWGTGTGAGAAYAFWHFGANGVEGALNVRAAATGGSEWWGWYAIALFVIVSLGLIDIALRRAIRIQQDTEGLV